MKGAELDRFDRIAQRIVGRQNDDRRFRKLAFDFAQNVEAIGIRQAEIEQHQVGLDLAHEREAGGGGVRGCGSISVAARGALRA